MGIKNLAFYLKNRVLRPHSTRVYRRLKATEGISTEELERVNFRKRQEIVRHAYGHSPFYRRLYAEAGFNPSQLESPADWEKVPLVSKQMLQTGWKEFVCPKVPRRRLSLSTTGGSTGQPLQVYHDRAYPAEALGWRMLGWWGCSPSEDAAYCWRLQRKSRRAQLQNALLWWPTRRIWLDATEMSPAALEIFVQQFNALQPPLLQGYSGAILELAAYIREKGLKVHSPRAVWVTSSPTPKGQARLIEQVFSAPVYDQYGCGEVFWLAAQCSVRSGLHFFYDARHIEFLAAEGSRPASGNSFGEVTITDLENKAFPIVRYQNGDLGRWLPEGRTCSCGCSLPLIDAIRGRSTDLLRLPDRTVIAGDFVTTLFDGQPWLAKAFQVIQQKDYSIDFKVVPADGSAATKAGILEVSKQLETKMRGAVVVRLHLIPEIEHQHGKLRFVVSHLSPYQDAF